MRTLGIIVESFGKGFGTMLGAIFAIPVASGILGAINKAGESKEEKA